jgi:hypothetical protein
MMYRGNMMGTSKSLLPQSLRKKTSWGELTLDEKEKVATYLVVGAYYPPPPASSRKRSAKATAKKNKGRRKKAVRVLLIQERAQRFDQAISALAAGKGSNDCKVLHKLIEPVVQLWDEGLVEGLSRQPSLRFYNELRSREIWGELANSYLIAVALIRQRHEHARSSRVKDAGLRRATWLVESTYPPKCDYAYARSKLEVFIQDRRAVWPLVCALLYQYSLQRNIDLESTEQPLHQLLPPTPPSTRELINAFLEAPAGVFSAAKYFEEQLCRSSSLREQLTAPLMAADCTSLPFFDDLKFGFTMPPAFARMSPPELDLAKKYQTSMYKQSKRSRTDPLKK